MENDNGFGESSDFSYIFSCTAQAGRDPLHSRPQIYTPMFTIFTAGFRIILQNAVLCFDIKSMPTFESISP
jgi:hypothetical protein